MANILEVEFDFEKRKGADQGMNSGVFLIKEKETQRTRILKLLKIRPHQVSALSQEAAALSCLEHQNVARIHTAGEVQNLPNNVAQSVGMTAGDTAFGLCLDYYSDGSLQDLLERGPMPIRTALKAGIDTAHALVAAHQKSLLHLDVKPSNILVSGQTFLLTDFGQSRFLDSSGVAFQNRIYVCSFTPEQAVATLQKMPAALTVQTDIYQFGIFLLRLVWSDSFEVLKTLGSFQAILKTIADGKFPPKDLCLPPHVPPGLVRIIKKCLQPNPAKRYSSMADVQEALTKVTGTMDVTFEKVLNIFQMVYSGKQAGWSIELKSTNKGFVATCKGKRLTPEAKGPHATQKDAFNALRNFIHV